MTAIHEAVAVSPTWFYEPLSSLQADDKPQSASAVDDAPLEFGTPLPTIQSLSELESQADPLVPEPATRPKSRLDSRQRPNSRLDMALRQEQQMQVTSLAAVSRRSSTASVKAFFSPLSLDPSTRITRPSSQVRQQVDQALHDVISEHLMAARSQALMREEDLFQVRRKPGAVMARSNSGLSITGAMNLAAKRRRHDNVLASRRKGSLDGGSDHPSDLDVNGKSLTTLSGRAKSLASRRRKKPLPSLVPAASNLMKVESEAELDIPIAQSPGGLLDSPRVPSQCSSTTSSNAGSALPSPVDLAMPLHLPDLAPDATLRQSDVIIASGEEFRPKRTRSMVDNVRYFFQSRPASPSSSSGHNSPLPVPLVPQEPESQPPSSFVQWWRKGSLRRRVQSSPEVPGEEPQLAIAGRASEDNRASLFATRLPDTSEEQPSKPTPDGGETRAPSNHRRVAFNDTIPSRRRSLFAPSTRFRDSSPQHNAPEPPPAVPRKSLKSVWFFQRSNSFTPMDVEEPHPHS